MGTGGPDSYRNIRKRVNLLRFQSVNRGSRHQYPINEDANHKLSVNGVAGDVLDSPVQVDIFTSDKRLVAWRRALRSDGVDRQHDWRIPTFWRKENNFGLSLEGWRRERFRRACRHW